MATDDDGQSLSVTIEEGVLRSRDRGMALKEALRKGLSRMEIIRSIEVRWKRLGDNFVREICSFVKASNDLTSIDLSDNYIGDTGCKNLSASLTNNTRIKSLILSGNRIGDLGVATLSTMLITNSTLQHLNLSANSIEQMGMQALGGGLRQNQGLKELLIVENFFGDPGALEMGWALTYNTTMTNLSIKSNDIGNAGAVMLASSLQKNKVLKQLNLSDNNISDRGVMHLCESLFANQTLRSLDLTLNDFKGEGKDALLDCLDFSFVCEPAPDEHRLAIAMALHRRLGEESLLWKIGRIHDSAMMKAFKSRHSKKTSQRERTTFMDAERAAPVEAFPEGESWEQDMLSPESPLRRALGLAILQLPREILFDGLKLNNVQGQGQEDSSPSSGTGDAGTSQSLGDRGKQLNPRLRVGKVMKGYS